MSQAISGVALLDRMHNQVRNWEMDGDPRAVFLQCYQLMTTNMLKAVEENRFRDCAWISKLLHRFAEYYFEALDAYTKNDKDTPLIWSYVHGITEKKHLHVLQRLLLGINAHINYDLVLTLVEILDGDADHHGEEKLKDRFEDHCLVNDIIAESIDAVQDDIIEKQDPMMDLVDKVFGRMDEKLLSLLIKRWRGDVWESALEMLNCSCDSDREACRSALEKEVLKKGRLIALDLQKI